MKHKYYKLRENNELPDDVNSEWETLALNKYKSKLLYDAIVRIRKERLWTDKDMGTFILNRFTGDILCQIYANRGIIKEINFRGVKMTKEGVKLLSDEEKKVYSDIWNDKYLKLSESNMKRNENIDFFVPKKEKK